MDEAGRFHHRHAVISRSSSWLSVILKFAGANRDGLRFIASVPDRRRRQGRHSSFDDPLALGHMGPMKLARTGLRGGRCAGRLRLCVGRVGAKILPRLPHAMAAGIRKIIGASRRFFPDAHPAYLPRITTRKFSSCAIRRYPSHLNIDLCCVRRTRAGQKNDGSGEKLIEKIRPACIYWRRPTRAPNGSTKTRPTNSRAWATRFIWANRFHESQGLFVALPFSLLLLPSCGTPDPVEEVCVNAARTELPVSAQHRL